MTMSYDSVAIHLFMYYYRVPNDVKNIQVWTLEVGMLLITKFVDQKVHMRKARNIILWIVEQLQTFC